MAPSSLLDEELLLVDELDEESKLALPASADASEGATIPGQALATRKVPPNKIRCAEITKSTVSVSELVELNRSV